MYLRSFLTYDITKYHYIHMFIFANICLDICMCLHYEPTYVGYVDICGNPTWDHQECHPDCQPQAGALFSKLWPLIHWQSLVSQGCHWYQKPRWETLNNLKNTPRQNHVSGRRGPWAPGQARMVFTHNFWHRLIQPRHRDQTVGLVQIQAHTYTDG